MVCRMMASKLLGAVGIFLMANYAAVNGRCLKAPAPTEGTPRCPSTWSKWQDKCYKVHDSYVTWEEGKQICVEMDGVIVVPQSLEELQHLHNMCSCSWFLIGCSDIEVEGTWKCLDGEGIDVNDERWAEGEPDSRGGVNEDCPAGHSSGWHDRDCYDTHVLICQRPVSL